MTIEPGASSFLTLEEPRKRVDLNNYSSVVVFESFQGDHPSLKRVFLSIPCLITSFFGDRARAICFDLDATGQQTRPCGSDPPILVGTADHASKIQGDLHLRRSSVILT
jgi:hypothetical protein